MNNDLSENMKNNPDRISQLEGELNAIRSINNGIHDEAAKSTRIFQAVTIVVLIAGTISAGWFTIWSTDRVDSALSRAEERIANLTGGFIPKSARVEPFTGLSMLATTLYLSKSELFGRSGYRLNGLTKAQIVLEGDNPGKLLGFQAGVQGEFIDDVLERLDYTQHDYMDLTSPKYTSLGSTASGILVPTEVPLEISYRFSTFSESCELLQLLAKTNSDLVIEFRPILESSTYIPKSKKFTVIKNNRASDFDCSEPRSKPGSEEDDGSV